LRSEDYLQLGSNEYKQSEGLCWHQFNSPNAWYIPEVIANIFSMNELEKRYSIPHDSWQGYYAVHTKNGEVRFYKDENGVLYIDLKDSSEDAAALLVQTRSKEAAKVLMQTVRQNY
jgi:hypothetical protein